MFAKDLSVVGCDALDLETSTHSSLTAHRSSYSTSKVCSTSTRRKRELSVTFVPSVYVCPTYHDQEYDRTGTMVRSYSLDELKSIGQELRYYKRKDMPVHPESVPAKRRQSSEHNMATLQAQFGGNLLKLTTLYQHDEDVCA